MRYKTIHYWYNDLQGLYMAQVGYHIIATARTEGWIKRKINSYLED